MVIILIVLPAACHLHQPKPQSASRRRPPQPQAPGPTQPESVPHRDRASNHRSAGNGGTHHARPTGGRWADRPRTPDPDRPVAGVARRSRVWVPNLGNDRIAANNNNNNTANNCNEPQRQQPSAGWSYLTRIIISDDFPQVAIRGGDNATDNATDNDDEVETVNREEEIIKKRKTELTTTRQTETRIKRQLLFEDGKVIEDSGPIVSTNTMEDTDRQETVQTEHRALGDPESNREQPGTPDPEQRQQDELPAPDSSAATTPKKRNDGTTTVAATRPPDGLLRNVKEEVSVSRELTTERTEVAEQQHFGDFTDEAYLGVVRSGVGGDIRELLLSEKARAELSPPSGQPQIVQHTVQTKKVIDREDTDIRQLVKPDGTLVTEKQQTRQHEEVHDDELPPDSAGAYPVPGSDQAHNDERLIEQKSSAQRYYKQRDEQHVDLLANGRVIGHEMRYAAEQTQLEKDGQTAPGEPGMLSDWDSLSDRLRKARRLGRHPKELAPLVPGHSKGPNQHGAGLGFPAAGPGGPGPNDRLDALTKKPLDFDMEEETRKHETNKWLECHFGSESRSSRDSHEELDELLVEPTKKTYFNVTIKSTDGNGSLLGPIDAPDRPNYSGPSASTGAKRDPLDASKGEPGLYPAGTPLNWSNRGPRSTSPGCRREDTPFGSGSGGRGYRKGFRETKKHESPEQIGTDKTGSYVMEPRATELGGDGLPRDRPPRQPYSGHPEQPDGRPQVPQRRKQLAQSFAAGRENRSLQEHQPLQHQARQHPAHQQYPSNARPQYEVKPVRGAAIVHGYGPRSRSVSPIPIPPVAQTMRKPYQKTRFSSIQDLSHGHGQGGGERSVGRPQSALSKSNFVGSAIGKSFRKLMCKIRSNSAERKLKMKSSKLQQQQQQQRSSSPVSSLTGQGSARLKHQSPTYQQYNVIDGHISNSGSPPPPIHEQQRDAHVATDLPLSDGTDRPTLRRNGHRTQQQQQQHQQEVVDSTSGSGLTPRQTYYLGENPYGAGIYGKENKYNDATATDMSDSVGVGPKVPGRHYTSSQPRVFQHLPHSNRHSNLGRFSKSTNRLPTSSHGGHYEHPEVQYLGRPVASLHSHSSQTLPRNDLHHQHNKLLHGSKPLHSSTINVSIVNRVNLPTASPVAGQSQVLATAGPVKPARSYKTLNRSKSFNVHGLNGTNDPSPIYLEKLQRNQHAPVGGFYRSSSYLEEQKDPSSLQLKSPSIVNYISRSTRDLTNGPLYESDRIDAAREPDSGGPTHTLDKKGMFLRNLQNRAPELYRTLHEGDMCRESPRSASRDYLNTYITRGQEQALGSRIPVGPNKDTASIVPRSGSSPDDYSDQRKHLIIRKGSAFGMADQQNLPVRYRVESDLKYQRINDSPNVGGVVIELRNNS
ncbi:uncharacterized protein LOC128271560 [Anopheles cruzii]|uniref:uncharacterized protein LOC128271560 n=1 Tax=Anopheles cruzii TaxID=68878 RepID=UPI0022EC2E15|nr:uncharacterized protein LOC128271560 [Anopheles cruzii]